MTDVPAKNTPMLAGWVMAAGFGAVAAGVSYVALSMGGMGAAFVGSVIFAGTGAILGLPRNTALDPDVSAVPVELVADRPVGVAAASAAHMADAAAAPVSMASPVSAPLSEVAPVAAPEAPSAASRPAGLAMARDGKADDLKIIKGIGPKLEQLCQKLGYFHFDQIAAWTGSEVAWVDDNLEGFKGRVTRDGWVPQAKAIMAHGPEEFLRRLDAGEAF